MFVPHITKPLLLRRKSCHTFWLRSVAALRCFVSVAQQCYHTNQSFIAAPHLPQLLHVTATCRPASHLFIGSPSLRYGWLILMTSMRQRIGLAAPRHSASLRFYVGAAAASFALRSGWHGGVVADAAAFFSSLRCWSQSQHTASFRSSGLAAIGCSA